MLHSAALVTQKHEVGTELNSKRLVASMHVNKQPQASTTIIDTIMRERMSQRVKKLT